MQQPRFLFYSILRIAAGPEKETVKRAFPPEISNAASGPSASSSFFPSSMEAGRVKVTAPFGYSSLPSDSKASTSQPSAEAKAVMRPPGAPGGKRFCSLKTRAENGTIILHRSEMRYFRMISQGACFPCLKGK